MRQTIDGLAYNAQDYYGTELPKKPDDYEVDSDDNDTDKGYIKLFTKNKNTSRPNQLLMCTTCGNTFTKLCNVMDHIRMHRGLRPFMCRYCN